LNIARARHTLGAVVEPPTIELDGVFQALSDPTRRAILRRLSQGEARVTDLAGPFEMSLNAVSKHIRALERANLVRRRRAGREHFLSYNPAPLDRAASWIDAQRGLWAARLAAIDDLLRTDDESAPHPTEREGHTQ
jgi:DNA-binding transcriptional ArsR family regulator